MKYKLTLDAENDLTLIAQYTYDNWGNKQVVSYLKGLQEMIEMFSEGLFSGREQPDIDAKAFSFSYASHIVYYLIEDDIMIVFGVLHKSMVPQNHLGNRDF